jgi:hypothetical protein
LDRGERDLIRSHGTGARFAIWRHCTSVSANVRETERHLLAIIEIATGISPVLRVSLSIDDDYSCGDLTGSRIYGDVHLIKS